MCSAPSSPRICIVANASTQDLSIGLVRVPARTTATDLAIDPLQVSAHGLAIPDHVRNEAAVATLGDLALRLTDTEATWFVQPHARWMELLHPFIANRRLDQLFMIGSHDCGSYGLSADDAIDLAPDIDPGWGMRALGVLRHALDAGPSQAPDTPRALALLRELNDAAKAVSIAWSKTQSGTLFDQLAAGARVFDLRLAHRPALGALAAVHGFYGASWAEMLADLHRFREAAPREIIVLTLRLHGALPAELREQLRAQLAALPLIPPEHAPWAVAALHERGEFVALSCDEPLVPGRTWGQAQWSEGVPWRDDRVLTSTDDLAALWDEELGRHASRPPGRLASFGETLTTLDQVTQALRAMLLGEGDAASGRRRLHAGLRGVADTVNPWALLRVPEMLARGLNVLSLDFCTDPGWSSALLAHNGRDAPPAPSSNHPLQGRLSWVH